MLGVNVDANGSANRPTTQTPLFRPSNPPFRSFFELPSAALATGHGHIRLTLIFGRPEKRKAATMQIRLSRTADESRTGHMKIVRVPSTVHAVPRLHHIVLPSPPQPKADQPQSESVAPADDTPAARARRALWKSGAYSRTRAGRRRTKCACVEPMNTSCYGALMRRFGVGRKAGWRRK